MGTESCPMDEPVALNFQFNAVRLFDAEQSDGMIEFVSTGCVKSSI